MLLTAYKNLLTLCLTSFLTALIFSHNLIFFFISWVGINVSLYGSLLFSTNKTRIVTEAVSKYFIVGVLVTVTFLFSTLLYLVSYGTYSTESLSFIVYKGLSNSELLTSPALAPIEVFFYSANISLFLFKLGAFPFHFYLPDIYNILDKKTNMLCYTVLVKLLIFLAMLSFLSQFWYISDFFSVIFLLSSIGSLAVSSISSIAEQNIRRFLSLSYLNSLGYILLAVSSGLSYGFGALTFYSAELYLLSYLLAWLLVYFVIFNSASLYANSDMFIYFTDIVKLSSSNKKNFTTTLTKIALVVAVLSLLGLPPTVGFYAKSVLYLSVISSDISTFTLMLVLVLAPVMSMSYIRLVTVMLFPQPSKHASITLNRLELCVYERDLSILDAESSPLKLILYTAAMLVLVLIVPIPYIISIII